MSRSQLMLRETCNKEGKEVGEAREIREAREAREAREVREVRKEEKQVRELTSFLLGTIKLGHRFPWGFGSSFVSAGVGLHGGKLPAQRHKQGKVSWSPKCEPKEKPKRRRRRGTKLRGEAAPFLKLKSRLIQARRSVRVNTRKDRKDR